MRRRSKRFGKPGPSRPLRPACSAGSFLIAGLLLAISLSASNLGRMSPPSAGLLIGGPPSLGAALLLAELRP